MIKNRTHKLILIEEETFEMIISSTQSCYAQVLSDTLLDGFDKNFHQKICQKEKYLALKSFLRSSK